MLFVSSVKEELSDVLCFRFNLGIEMLFVSSFLRRFRPIAASGEFQSRNRDAFRFKWRRTRRSGESHYRGFNLGIEMLFVSRLKANAVSVLTANSVSISESRCFSFQEENPNPQPVSPNLFQSRNRDAFRFKPHALRPLRARGGLFQSRNRDAFRFKDISKGPMAPSFSMFQSRNRDAFRFKSGSQPVLNHLFTCFNLGIEMLFVSS